jgi:cytochrome c peroxidase
MLSDLTFRHLSCIPFFHVTLTTIMSSPIRANDLPHTIDRSQHEYRMPIRLAWQDELGETQFDPPSLRGIGQQGPYFHDGRAKTLDEVLKSSHHDLEKNR